MFQKFNEDTIGSRFIKSLLAQTKIPLFGCVIDGDQIVEDLYYVYKTHIIKCTKSGILGTSASYDTTCLIDAENITLNSTFTSTSNHYDSETHYHLGRYLRYLRTTNGLNLMPYYNCYGSKTISDLELVSTMNDENKRVINAVRSENQHYKVVAVPILFGKKYSIAIDCPSKVVMRACLYDDSGFFDESRLSEDSIKVLSDSAKTFAYMFFNKLETFQIDTEEKELALLEKDLYLIIQLPRNNDSSIVVLENYEDRTGVYCNEDSVKEVSFVNLSLLQMNTRCSYAFSDRLIEYLLGNVICEQTDIPTNISKIQDAISTFSDSYKHYILKHYYTKGIWDKDIPRIVLEQVEIFAKDNIIYDQDGNINKDVEKILHNKGGYY